MKRFIKHFTAASCLGAALFTVMGCGHDRGCVDSCWPKPHNSTALDRVHEMQNARTDHGHKLEQVVWNNYFAKDERTGDGTTTLNETGQEFLRHLARCQPLPDPQIWLQYPSDVTDTSKHDQVIAERRIAIRKFLTKETHLGDGEKYQIAVLDPGERTGTVAWTEKAKKATDIRGKLTVEQREDASVGSGGGIRGKSTVEQREDKSAGSGGGIPSKVTLEQREDASGSGGGIPGTLSLKQREDASGSGGGIPSKVTLEQREDASGSGGGIPGTLSLKQREDASGSGGGIPGTLSLKQREDASGNGGGITGKVTLEQREDASGSGGGIPGKLTLEQREDASGSGGGSRGAGGVVARNCAGSIATDSAGACQRRMIAR
jgi:hypothetical protein